MIVSEGKDIKILEVDLKWRYSIIRWERQNGSFSGKVRLPERGFLIRTIDIIKRKIYNKTYVT